MLTAIEGCLEQLFETIESLPADKVEAAEKVKVQPHHYYTTRVCIYSDAFNSLFSSSVEGKGEKAEVTCREDGRAEIVSGVEAAQNARESPSRPLEIGDYIQNSDIAHTHHSPPSLPQRGRRLVYRSEPPVTRKKQTEKTKAQKEKEEEEMLYFFT